MKYKVLGRSEMEVSEISFGCMGLGLEQKESSLLIEQAIESGINFFDTADLYQQGQNEITVGKALHGKRNNVYISTKVGNKWNSDGTSWEWCPDKAYILSAVEDSLRRLGTDYIDLYQLHGGTLEDPIDEIIEAFEILQKQGKIRYFGLSSIRPNVIRTYISRTSITSVMLQYSLLDRRPEEELLDLLGKNNTGILARGTLAQGLLINKPAKPYLSYNEDEVTKIQKLIGETAIGEGKSNDSIAMQYLFSFNAVTSAVVGIKNLQHLEIMEDLSHLSPLSAASLSRLKSEIPMISYEQHR